MPCFLASRSLITPLEVDIMATPRPPRTFGKPLVFFYILKPGLLTLCIDRIVGNLFLPLYLSPSIICDL